MYHYVAMKRDKLYTSMGQYTSAKSSKRHTVNFQLYNFTKIIQNSKAHRTA